MLPIRSANFDFIILTLLPNVVGQWSITHKVQSKIPKRHSLKEKPEVTPALLFTRTLYGISGITFTAGVKLQPKLSQQGVWMV